MNGKKIFYFLIIILIVIVCFSIFKDKASYNDKNQNQIESKKTDTIHTNTDLYTENTVDTETEDLQLNGYILSVYNHSFDIIELLKMTNLDNKTPIYCQLYQDYNSAAIIETNQKVGPLYLVDCSYDKESDKYTIDYDSKQLLNEYILASDVLFFLNKVESNVSKKGILILHKNKYYLYPLSTQNIDSLIPSKLYKL